jgi:hypothetical protein
MNHIGIGREVSATLEATMAAGINAVERNNWRNTGHAAGEAALTTPEARQAAKARLVAMGRGPVDHEVVATPFTTLETEAGLPNREDLSA